MKKIMFTRPDGGLSILEAASKMQIENVLGKLTDEQYKAHVWGLVPSNAINPIEIDDNVIPASREFRDAWKHANGTIEHDLDKAKDIQLTRIRLVRESKFAELDKQYMLSLERNESADKIIAAKQKLRDITGPLKALSPKSIDEIKNSFPEELK